MAPNGTGDLVRMPCDNFLHVSCTDPYSILSKIRDGELPPPDVRLVNRRGRAWSLEGLRKWSPEFAERVMREDRESAAA